MSVEHTLAVDTIPPLPPESVTDVAVVVASDVADVVMVIDVESQDVDVLVLETDMDMDVDV